MERNSLSQNESSQKGKKRMAETKKNGIGSKRRPQQTEQSGGLKNALEELKNNEFQSTKHISLVEESKMLLHPKGQFIKSFKNSLPHVASERKKLVSELRSDLIRYVVEKYHREVPQDKIIVQSKTKIDAIAEDIFTLSMAIHEKRKLVNANGMFKNKEITNNFLSVARMPEYSQPSTNTNTKKDGSKSECEFNESDLDEENDDDGFDVEGEDDPMQVFLANMKTLIESNHDIKKELSQLVASKENVDVKIKEIQVEIIKHKKESHESNVDIKRELSRIGSQGNQTTNTVNKLIEKIDALEVQVAQLKSNENEVRQMITDHNNEMPPQDKYSNGSKNATSYSSVLNNSLNKDKE